MTGRIVEGSVCRIADLRDAEQVRLPRERWATGDYLVGEVVDKGGLNAVIESPSGRMVHVDIGDRVAGAFGVRHATLEATGTWREIGDDGRLHAMTSAGVFGRLTSVSPFVKSALVTLEYRGHLLTRGGDKLTMPGAVDLPEPRPWTLPTILIVGSSMSAGKTATARIIIRRLVRNGLRVLGAKLTGCGRYRDILSMGDAGADATFDFIDGGMPSTVCDEADYADRAARLLTRMSGIPADVAVIEAGASPLEPYNGAAAVALLAPATRLRVLCASDPYAVLGIQTAFGFTPDLVGGIATNTDAGVELIQRLCGVPALSLLVPDSLPALDRMLSEALDLS